MSKYKLNLIGGGFQHHIQCSSALNTNQYVEWVLDQTSNISVHVDNAIFSVPVDKTKFNIAWLAESSAIIAHIIQNIQNNTNNIFEQYDMFITHDLRLLNISNKFKYVPTNALPWIQNKKIYTKTKLISMIGSAKTMCPGHIYRQKIIQKYNNVVDHFGRGFLRELPWTYIDEYGKEESGKLHALKDYYYSIAMENDNYDIIFCEKLTDCFVTGTIPIFWGSKKIIEIFNKDGIIFLEDFDIAKCTPDYYYSKLDAIKENFEIACNLLSAEDFLYLNYLKNL